MDCKILATPLREDWHAFLRASRA